MSSDIMTGVIKHEKKDRVVVFSAKQDDFDFCFMTDSIYEFDKSNPPIKISPLDGFIFGKTHTNYPIAIYVGQTPFEIIGRRNLITSAYVLTRSVLSNNPVTEYQAIQFQGGTLNQVFCPKGIKCDHIGTQIIISPNDDCIRHTLSVDGSEIKLIIRSSTNEQYGIDGFSFNNRKVELTLEFDKPQPLSTLFDHYNRMRDMLSFLTFRNNVGFESIELLELHPALQILTTSAEVFIRNDEPITEKNVFRNICFDDLGDALPALVKLFYSTEDKKPSKSLGFYAINDNDQTMTNAKIRAICSALECELSFLPEIKADEKPELDELVTIVHDTVKDFQKRHSCLSNDTYNTIFSSIGNWSFPLKEKLCALYQKNLREMLKLNKSDITITDELIGSFVKYRNDITHGRHRTLDLKTAITAYYLGGLVYCCILNRIGIDRKKILELCESKILS